MSFDAPWILLFLPLAPLAVYLAKKRGKPAGILFPDGAILVDRRASWRTRLAEGLPCIRLLALALLIIALARPQMDSRAGKTASEGIDIILAVDVSTSMLAEDPVNGGERRSRVAVARQALGEFMAGRPDDRIGVVLFAGRAYPLSPLTRDHEWLRRNLVRIEPGIIEDGTAIGSGILSALGRLKRSGDRERVVILLTDGRNNAGEVNPAVAAEAARAIGVRVHAIGVGSRGDALFPVRDPFGNTIYKKADADLDEVTLGKIAQTTGGSYFRAAEAGSLANVYREIDLLEKKRLEEKVHLRKAELFPVFLLAAISLLLLEFTLERTILRRLP